jgi:hypothetical protein
VYTSDEKGTVLCDVRGTYCLSLFIYFVIISDIYEEEPVKGSNGSKTAVMDVIGFPCVSLGSSTVQLHESPGSRRACMYSKFRFSSPNNDRV